LGTWGRLLRKENVGGQKKASVGEKEEQRKNQREDIERTQE